jgi:hypothetical protein
MLWASAGPWLPCLPMEIVIYGTADRETQEALWDLSRSLSVDPAKSKPILPGALAALQRTGVIGEDIETFSLDQFPRALGPRAVWIDDALLSRWLTPLEAVVCRYVRALSRDLDAFTGWLDQCRFEGDPVGVRWAALAGWLVDIEVNEALKVAGWFEGEARGLPSVWFFQTSASDGPSFGVRLQCDRATCAVFGELWMTGVRKTPQLVPNLATAEISALAGLAAGGPRAAASLGGGNLLSKPRFFRLVTGTPPLRLAVPHLSHEAGGAYVGIVRNTARRVAGESVLAPGIDPHVPAQGDQAGYRHAFARLVMRGVVAELLKRGVLVWPAHPVSVSWGTWLSTGGEPYLCPYGECDVRR